MLTAEDALNQRMEVEEDEVVRVSKKKVYVCEEYEQALEIQDTKPKEAIKLYLGLINSGDYAGPRVKVVEESIYRLGSLYAKDSLLSDLKDLFIQIRQFFAEIPKAKTAKIIRTLIETVSKAEGATVQLQSDIVKDAIKWCVKEKRNFLKQRMEAKLAALLVDDKQYKEALVLVTRLIREVKKFDDKLLMVEICLVESRASLHLENIPKAKSALTTARSSANAIYCPPTLQAEIDRMAGILCTAEDDYKTGYSYFYEAFEGFNTIDATKAAVQCIKYMLLTKIMSDLPGDVYTIINGKAGVKYAGIEIEAMKAVADAYKKRSIHAFDAVSAKYTAQLKDDPVIANQLSTLSDNLLDANIMRLIEPYQKVEIEYVAKLIELPVQVVESKLSQMILDTKLNGILDQGNGILVIYDLVEADTTYDTSLETIKELKNVVDQLYVKAKRVIK